MPAARILLLLFLHFVKLASCRGQCFSWVASRSTRKPPAAHWGILFHKVDLCGLSLSCSSPRPSEFNGVQQIHMWSCMYCSGCTCYFEVGSTNKITDSIGQTLLWYADSYLPGQEILRLLCIPNVHYCVHDSHPLNPILSQINPINLKTYFFLTPILILYSYLRLGFPSLLLSFPK